MLTVFAGCLIGGGIKGLIDDQNFQFWRAISRFTI